MRLAEHRRLRQPVAITFLQIHDDEEAAARFTREMRILTRISHPNLLRIIDAGSVLNVPYLAVEYLSGGTLKDRLAEGNQLSLAATIQIGRDCLAGLQACHDAGVIHRDLKPANILFTSDDRAKIADLGVSTALGEERLTRTGMILGTPLYMAPEQLKGATAHPSADIYAMGLVLRECLTGRPRVSTTDLRSLVWNNEPLPRVSHLRGDIPTQIDTVLERALAEFPANRFSSAAEFADALCAVKHHSLREPCPPLAPELPAAGTRWLPRKARWHWPYLLVVGLVILLGFGWLALQQPSATFGQPRFPSRGVAEIELFGNFPPESAFVLSDSQGTRWIGERTSEPQLVRFNRIPASSPLQLCALAPDPRLLAGPVPILTPEARPLDRFKCFATDSTICCDFDISDGVSLAIELSCLDPRRALAHRTTGRGQKVLHASFQGLTPDTRYTLSVQPTGGWGGIAAYEIRTLPIIHSTYLARSMDAAGPDDLTSSLLGELLNREPDPRAAHKLGCSRTRPGQVNSPPS